MNKFAYTLLSPLKLPRYLFSLILQQKLQKSHVPCSCGFKSIFVLYAFGIVLRCSSSIIPLFIWFWVLAFIIASITNFILSIHLDCAAFIRKKKNRKRVINYYNLIKLTQFNTNLWHLVNWVQNILLILYRVSQKKCSFRRRANLS